jgi:hypothetical protein
MAPDPSTTPDDVPPIVRRTRSGGKFTPRPPKAEQGAIVSRNILASRATDRAQTSRERIVAGDLPDWDPLPPGEVRVQRP